MKVDERGMALVEAILLGLVLMVPLLWLLGFLDHVHRAALGATAAARSAGFEVAASADPEAAHLEQVVALALKDQGLATEQAQIDVRMSDDGDRGALVQVEVRYAVPMLDIPSVGRFPSLWVTARHDAVIDPYRSR